MGRNSNNTPLHGANENCEEKLKGRLANNNKNWVICILVLIALILVAVILASRLFDTSNVSLVITFTATILSIVLSLFAILYSFHGIVESSRNLGEIRSAVAEIKATEEAIKSIIQMIDRGVSDVNANMNFIGNQIANSINATSSQINNAYREPRVNETGPTDIGEQENDNTGANVISDDVS